jgi:hypothetical protein
MCLPLLQNPFKVQAVIGKSAGYGGIIGDGGICAECLQNVNGKEKREKWNDRPVEQATHSIFQPGVLRFRSGHGATIAQLQVEWPLFSGFALLRLKI